MGSEQAIKASELESYDFGNPVAPEGFDPNAAGFENTPAGWHVFELQDFEIFENHTFNGKDFGQWVGNQIRPKLVVPPGEKNTGSSQLDFLPLPTQGRPMPRALANRWANFIASFGFKCPADKLVPTGFKLHDLLNGNEPGTKTPKKPWHRGRAEVVLDEYDGKKQLKIRYFGYKPLSEPEPAATTTNGNGSTSVNKKANGNKTVSPPPVSDLNLDDL